MRNEAQKTDSRCPSADMTEELVGILAAISIVSKRLAIKLSTIATQREQKEKGDEADESE
jgi:Na+-translocating ferredoxin:NAD+ oxidoreductase RnfC subunit